MQVLRPVVTKRENSACRSAWRTPVPQRRRGAGLAYAGIPCSAFNTCSRSCERGTTYRPETFKDALTAALAAAGVDKQPRAFHDLRHTAITNDAAAGSSPIAVMTKAGHADLATTKRYMHLAGVVFRDEADALERRLGLSTEPSTRPSAPQRTSDDSVGVAAPLRASAE